MAKQPLDLSDSAEPQPPLYGCAVKRIKKKNDYIAAAEKAIEIFAMNRPKLQGLSRVLTGDALAEVMAPMAIAVLTDKKWDPTKTVDLGVGFMEPTSTELQNKIISYLMKWNTVAKANVRFRPASLSLADMRISRGRGGYYSYLGPDILSIPKDEQTMNLEAFVLKTPDSEYDRVVCHEGGHTLGFPHEHMRPELVALLDEAKTIAYFERTQGWTEQEVRQQVLTPLSKAKLEGTAPDQISIMCYQLPGSITKNGQPIPGGTGIDPTDAAFAAKLYPIPGGPPQPPEPPAPPVVLAGSVRVDLARKKVYFPTGWTGEVGV